MAVDVDIRGDAEELLAHAARVEASLIPRASATALNRVNRTMVSRIVRALSSELGIKPAKRLRRRVFSPRDERATPDKLRTGGFTLLRWVPLVWFAGRSRNLSQFEGPNQFGAVMPSGRAGVYSRRFPPVRVGPGARRRPQARRSLPLNEATRDVSSQASRITGETLTVVGVERFAIEFARAFNRLRARAVRRG